MLKDNYYSKKHIIEYLINQNKKIYSFHFNKVGKKKKNLFSIIYHKKYEPFFELQTSMTFKTIIGMLLIMGLFCLTLLHLVGRTRLQGSWATQPVAADSSKPFK